MQMLATNKKDFLLPVPSAVDICQILDWLFWICDINTHTQTMHPLES